MSVYLRCSDSPVINPDNTVSCSWEVVSDAQLSSDMYPRLSQSDFETLAGFIVSLFVLAVAGKFLLRLMDSSASRYGG